MGVNGQSKKVEGNVDELGEFRRRSPLDDGGQSSDHAVNPIQTKGNSSMRNKRKLDKENLVTDEEENLEMKKYLQSRCAIHHFVETIKSFDECKKMAAEELGFGGLVRLQLTKLDLKLIEVLAKNFDSTTSSLNVHGHKLMLSPNEVEWILGLPSNGVDVENFLSKDMDVRKVFNLPQSRIAVSKLVEDLKILPPNDEFKAKFLLYVVSTVIRPNTSFYTINPKYVGLLKDISSIRNLNWAKFTLEGLVDGIRYFQDKQSDACWTPRITGCILLLEVFYLEHLAVGPWKIPRHLRSCPRVPDWNNVNVGKILNHILKIGGYDELDSMKIEILGGEEDVYNDLG